MQCTIGKPLFFEGSRKDVQDTLFSLAVDLIHQAKTVLIIDTQNCLNHHHAAFFTPSQRLLFRKIYCVRIDKPYDLLARLSTSERFIADKNIDALLITSLSAPFEHAEKEEVLPLLHHLTARIEHITHKHNLMTAIGICPADEETVMMAYDALAKKVM